MVDRLAEPALETITPDAIAALRKGPHDLETMATRGYGHERLDQLVTELLLGALLTIDRAARSRYRLVDPVDEGRGARRRFGRARRARAGTASGDDAAPQRAGPERVVGRARRGDRCGRLCGDRGDRRGGRRRAAARDGRARRRRARSIRPAKLWNDTESAPDAQWLRRTQLDGGEAAGPRRAVRCRSPRSRSRSCRGCTGSEPDAWARVARVCLPHDWLTWKLTGAFVTDRGDASGTGYFSAARDEYVLDLLGDRRCRCRLGPAAPARCCAVRARRARRSPSVSTRSSAPGTGDNMAAAIALGLRPGDVAISLGTSGTVYTVSESPTADAIGAVAGFADATGRFLPLVCTLNATKVTDSIARAGSVSTTPVSMRSRSDARPAPGRRRRSVLRRRAHAEPARRVGSDRRDCEPTPPGSNSRAPRSRAWCAGCSTVSMR